MEPNPSERTWTIPVATPAVNYRLRHLGVGNLRKRRDPWNSLRLPVTGGHRDEQPLHGPHLSWLRVDCEEESDMKKRRPSGRGTMLLTDEAVGANDARSGDHQRVDWQGGASNALTGPQKGGSGRMKTR